MGGINLGWNHGDRLLDAEEKPGSRYRQSLGGQARPQAPSRYVHVKQEEHEFGTPDLPTIEPGSLHPVYIYMGWGFWVQMLEGQGACDRVILVLRECIRNTQVDLLVLKAFDDTGSLSSPRRVVSLPGSTLGDCLPFPCGE